MSGTTEGGRVVVVTGGSRGIGRAEEFRAHVAGTVPAGRVGEAAEVVGAILYLTGPDAGYTTTGATIKVDGGMAWST